MSKIYTATAVLREQYAVRQVDGRWELIDGEGIVMEQYAARPSNAEVIRSIREWLSDGSVSWTIEPEGGNRR